MNEVLDVDLWGDCDLCRGEDLRIWVFVDADRKGHKLCRECLETLIEWGLIEKPEFKLEDEK